MHWVPNEPLVTHTCNVLHLLLPEGERWFVDVFTAAVPLIKDDKLRDEVLGFIGQESIHAWSHQGVPDRWKANGIDTDPYVQQVGWMFQEALGDRDLAGKGHQEWLIERLAIIAAIEHITAMLGDWALNAAALDAAGADRRPSGSSGQCGSGVALRAVLRTSRGGRRALRDRAAAQ
jgi:predicted metal-dependent hydrolase